MLMVNLPHYAAKLETTMMCYDGDDNELGGCGDAPKLVPAWIVRAFVLLVVGGSVAYVVWRIVA